MLSDEERGHPTVGMALYGDLTYDSRVQREASSLAAAGYQVRLFCLSGDGPGTEFPPGVTVIRHRPTSTSVLPRSHNPYYAPGGRIRTVAARATWLRGYVTNLRSWGRWVLSNGDGVDLWHAHDLTALVAIAPVMGRDIPVIYDAHEIYLEAGTARMLPGIIRRLLRRYEGRLVKRAAALVTVNESLAKVFRTRYKPRRIQVVHNCPDLWTPPEARPTLIRDATGIPPDEAVVLHHGSLGPGRGIEQLMAAMLEPGLERANLVLLGYGDWRERYAEMAREPARRGRVHVLDAVPPGELLGWVASADLGALPIQASTMNHRLATPNKLFECLAAGTPVVASDFPTMRSIVMDDPAGPLGEVCDPSSVTDVARGVRSVLQLDAAAMAALRARCLASARDRWNWESEAAGLVGLYRSLLGAP